MTKESLADVVQSSLPILDRSVKVEVSKSVAMKIFCCGIWRRVVWEKITRISVESAPSVFRTTTTMNMQTVGLSKKVPEYQATRRYWLLLIDPVHLTPGFLQNLVQMFVEEIPWLYGTKWL